MPSPRRISLAPARLAACRSFAIKADIRDLHARRFDLSAQKTMYGGKGIEAGDDAFLFASENEGGHGLFARGTVTAVKATPTSAERVRQTPRVSVTVERTGTARLPLGRADLRAFRTWNDGRPETELNFKLYRQATDKIVGLSDAAAAFLAGRFDATP